LLIKQDWSRPIPKSVQGGLAFLLKIAEDFVDFTFIKTSQILKIVGKCNYKAK
jgi:hypothetical protein